MSSLRITALAVVLLGAALLASLIAPPNTQTSSATPTPNGIDSPLPSPTESTTPAPTATPKPTATPTPTNTPKPTTTPTVAPSPTPSPTPKGTSLLTLLSKLVVADEANAGSYLRDRFKHWVDADGDGCDTRDEVLIAEAVTAPTVSAGCALTGGSWRSAYDGITTTDPGSFDIDHLVPLKEAWVSGAYAWSDTRRESFANDLGVGYALIGVSASTNRSKADQDPAEWMPPAGSYACTYIADWIAVKVRWSLTINYTEFTTLYRYASDCPPFPGEVTPLP